MYHYQWGIGLLLYQKAPSFYIVEKDTKFEFTDQENTMLAISSLAILFSIIEIILAFASAKSCGDTGCEPPQENQVRIVTVNEKQRLFHVQSDVFEKLCKHYEPPQDSQVHTVTDRTKNYFYFMYNMMFLGS